MDKKATVRSGNLMKDVVYAAKVVMANQLVFMAAGTIIAATGAPFVGLALITQKLAMDGTIAYWLYNRWSSNQEGR